MKHVIQFYWVTYSGYNLFMNGSSHYCKNINSPLTKIRIKHDYNQISKMIFFFRI